MKRSIVFAWILLALGGCGAPGELSQEYGKTVRKLGIFPVYPPREEFQIGDIYAWSVSKSNPNDSISIYLDNVHWLREAADEFMATRIVFENSDAVDSAGKIALKQTDIPSGQGGASHLTTRGELSGDNLKLARSLPITAFPRVSADAGFTAGLGIVQALTAVGLAGGQRTYVDLFFNDVRTYWLPTVLTGGDAATGRESANTALNRVFVEKIAFANGELERQAAARFNDPVPACSGARYCGMTLITRVYLTRRIDYTYRNSRIIAGALRQAQPGTSLSKVAPAPNININVANTQAGAVDPGNVDASVASVTQQLDRAVSEGEQGTSLRFVAWDARGMTFASNYQRPVVVGWDGLSRPIGIGAN